MERARARLQQTIGGGRGPGPGLVNPRRAHPPPRPTRPTRGTRPPGEAGAGDRAGETEPGTRTSAGGTGRDRGPIGPPPPPAGTRQVRPIARRRGRAVGLMTRARPPRRAARAPARGLRPPGRFRSKPHSASVYGCGLEPEKSTRQLLAVDHSARASMKNAASCEN